MMLIMGIFQGEISATQILVVLVVLVAVAVVAAVVVVVKYLH